MKLPGVKAMCGKGNNESIGTAESGCKIQIGWLRWHTILI